MYRIYRVYRGKKYYDSALYTRREARREMKYINHEYRGETNPYFLEEVR